MEQALNPEHLVEHVEGISKLAREIVRDECAAEDVTHEVILKVLRRGQGLGDLPNRWWATVVRNVARDRSRGRRRREEHEAMAAGARGSSGAGAFPSSSSGDLDPRAGAVDDAAELAERQRDVAAAVLGLGEPYRSVIVLRYYRDLPPREIARELRRPVGTVKVQLERARRALRDRLAADYGGGESLCLGLLPLVDPGWKAWVASAGVGGQVTGAPVKWILATSLLLLGGFWVLGPEADSDSAGGETPVASMADVATPEEAEGSESREVPQGPAVEGEREAVGSPTSVEATESSGSEVWIEGTAIDPSGQALAGLELAWVVEREDAGACTTDGLGNFRMAVATSKGSLRVPDPALEIVGERWELGERQVVVARMVLFAGHVVNRVGEPAKNAWVLEEGFEGNSLGSRRISETGAFNFGRIPTWSDRHVHFAHADGVVRVPVPKVDRTDVVVRIDVLEPNRALIVRVVDARGDGVTDAIVSVRGSAEVTGDDGLVEWIVDPWSENRDIFVARPGYLSVRAQIPRVAELREWATPLELLVPVTDPGETIEGIVVDVSGEPVPGAWVGIANPEIFGNEPARAVVSYRSGPGGRAAFSTVDAWFRQGPAEALTARGDHIYYRHWITDKEGRFEMTGLARRPYSLRVAAKKPLRVSRDVVVDAGSRSIELLLPGTERARPCVGRVVDGEGQPLEGVEVHAEVLVTHTPEPQGWISYNACWDEAVESDGMGVFRLPAICPEGCRIVARYGGHSGVTDADDPEPTIVIALPCSLRVRVGNPSGGQRLRVLDGDGKPLLFSWFEGGFEFMDRSECSISDVPGTLELTVPQTARVIVLLEGDRQVSRADVLPVLGGSALVEL